MFKKPILVVFVITLVLSVATATQAAAPSSIRLTWTGSVNTTQTFNWTTDTATTVGKIEYKKSSSNTYTTLTAATGVVYGNVKLWNHTLTGLTAGTTYSYRIGDGTEWSTYSTFKTAPTANPETVSFLVFGDSSNEDLEYADWGTTVNNAFAQNPKAKFMMNVGDIVEFGENPDHWAPYMAAGQNVLGKIPMMPNCAGDELLIDDDVLAPPTLYKLMWNLPQNGPPDFKGLNYSFDYGYAHIAVIMVSIADMFPGDNAAQDAYLHSTAAWLDTDMAATTKPWKIVVIHEGFYTNHMNRAGIRQRAILGPVMDANGVDIVFQGHDHIYSRTFPMNNKNQMGSPDQGTIYITVPGANDGIAKHEMNPKIWHSFYFDPQNQASYLTVEMESDEIKVIARLADGTLIDKFHIDRRDPSDTTPMVRSGKFDDPRVVLFGTLVSGPEPLEDEATGELYIPIKALIGFMNGDFDPATLTFSYEEGDEVVVFSAAYMNADRTGIKIEGLAAAGFEAYYDEKTNLFMIERWRQ